MMSKPLNLFHRGKSIDCASSAYISRKFGKKNFYNLLVTIAMKDKKRQIVSKMFITA